jgi:uncharacterized protein YukJ
VPSAGSAVMSQEKPAELLYVADENFRHPVTQSLPGLRAAAAGCRSRPQAHQTAAQVRT